MWMPFFLVLGLGLSFNLLSSNAHADGTLIIRCSGNASSKRVFPRLNVNDSKTEAFSMVLSMKESNLFASTGELFGSDCDIGDEYISCSYFSGRIAVSETPNYTEEIRNTVRIDRSTGGLSRDYTNVGYDDEEKIFKILSAHYSGDCAKHEISPLY